MKRMRVVKGLAGPMVEEEEEVAQQELEDVEDSSAKALVSLKEGSLSNTWNEKYSSPQKTLELTFRNSKRSRLFCDEEERQLNTRSPKRNPKTTIAPQKFTATMTTPVKKSAQKIGYRLRNLLKLPKAHKWCIYEWFYSNIDKPLFEGDNDFCVCLRESFPNLKTRKLTRVEWGKIRRLMGKPRRCSASFFEEERTALDNKRKKIRLLQQRKVADVSQFKELPEEIPLSLVIGTKVTARLRGIHDGLFTGQIDAVDTKNSTYRVSFDRNGLGTHTIPDYEVLGDEESFNQWVHTLNTLESTIRFQYVVSTKSVDYLDVRVFKHSGILGTTLYRKSTDQNTVLHARSCHQPSLIRNIPKAQFQRVRRNNTDSELCNTQLTEMMERFVQRGYKKKHLQAMRNQVTLGGGEDIKQDATERLTFVTTYSPDQYRIMRAIKEEWKLIEADGTLPFKRWEVPRLAYRRGRSLRDSLMKTDVSPLTDKQLWLKKKNGCYKCLSCVTCNSMQTGNSYQHPERKKKYKIHWFLTCTTTHIIYLLNCPCGKFYIGKSTDDARTRMDNHRSGIRTALKSGKSEQPVAQHFLENGHSITDLRFRLIDHMPNLRRGGNRAKILLQKEARWIHELGTLAPKSPEYTIWMASLPVIIVGPVLENDPLLGQSPWKNKISSTDGETIGGFPVEFLVQVTRLSKILMIKKEHIKQLRDMNTEAEKLKSYSAPIGIEFQKRYATIVLDLEQLNKDLNKVLHKVQQYCYELAPDQGLQPANQPTDMRRRCEEEAQEMVRHANIAPTGQPCVQDESLTDLISKLTAILLQIKCLAEVGDLNSFEFKSLTDSINDIKSSINPTNISCFQNNVEIHVAHIQSGLSQMGNLHAFAANNTNRD
ncbi:protein lin-9 homolog [Bombina bombina]|uniref:protein lin-9 homolog n=1 Tax=Bombina bombina TaxID=8345 RepID=UPI00235B2CD4|nr:protein lin-9 homolog [Bombina bombina]